MNSEGKQIEESRKAIVQELRSGEPFCYHKDGERLIVGVRMEYDDELDEFEVFVCDQYNRTDAGIIKKKFVNHDDAFGRDSE